MENYLISLPIYLNSQINAVGKFSDQIITQRFYCNCSLKDLLTTLYIESLEKFWIGDIISWLNAIEFNFENN